jgi:hypothetical protein
MKYLIWILGLLMFSSSGANATPPPPSDALLKNHIRRLGSALSTYSAAVKNDADGIDASRAAVAVSLKDWKATYERIAQQVLEHDQTGKLSEQVLRTHAGNWLAISLGEVEEKELVWFTKQIAIADDSRFAWSLIEAAMAVRY